MELFFLIRPISVDDAVSFVDAYLRSYESLSDYRYHTRREVKGYFRWLYRRDKDGFFVAERNGKFIGCVAGDSNWVNADGELVLEIHEIFVVPEERCKGVGSALMRSVLSYGMKRGRRLAELWVGEKNYRAIEFYRNLGFKEAGKWGIWLRMIESLNF